MSSAPNSNYFKPNGIPARTLENIEMTMDELEAIKLSDLEGMYQEDAAKKMGVSRQTFGNIVNSAHKKIADCLVNSKALKIEGGAVQFVETEDGFMRGRGRGMGRGFRRGMGRGFGRGRNFGNKFNY